MRWASICRDRSKGHLDGHCRHLGAPLASSSLSCPSSPALCPILCIPTTPGTSCSIPTSRRGCGQQGVDTPPLLALPGPSQQLLQPLPSQRRHSSLLRRAALERFSEQTMQKSQSPTLRGAAANEAGVGFECEGWLLPCSSSSLVPGWSAAERCVPRAPSHPGLHSPRQCLWACLLHVAEQSASASAPLNALASQTQASKGDPRRARLADWASSTCQAQCKEKGKVDQFTPISCN